MAKPEGILKTVWRRKIPILLACLLGLALNGYLWDPFLPYFFARANNDFACTYTGAVLAGSPGLYSVRAVMETERRLGDSPQFMMYQRFPYYAALVSPLRFLGYREAVLDVAGRLARGRAGLCGVLAGATPLGYGHRLLLEHSAGELFRMVRM